MTRTKVKNLTGFPVTLKVNSGGIQRNLLPKPLENNKAYIIDIETNTTYREYWCAVIPTGDSAQDLILSSDDCAEYSEVTLTGESTANGYRVSWNGSKSRIPRANPQGPPPAHAQAQAPGPPAGPDQVTPPDTNGPQDFTTVNARKPSRAGAQRSRCVIL